MVRFFATAFSLTLLIDPFTVLAVKNISTTTGDGLELRFSKTGEITEVKLNNLELPLSGPGGFGIREAGKSENFARVTGGFSASANSVRFQGEAEKLEVAAAFTTGDRCINLEGAVRNVAGGDRCVDLKFYLPIACNDWLWGTSMEAETAISNRIQGRKTADHITVYPVAPVSNTRLNAGLTLALPPTNPTLYETGADRDGVYFIFKLGLSDATVPANTTAFKLVLYRHDPAWGFRSSMQRYYEIFREPFFVRHVKKFGAWGWHHPPPSLLPNADLYAFHEAGGETWAIRDEGQHGYEHEGTNLAFTVADYARLAKVDEDERLGIYSLPYTIVGQRQIYRLSQLPRNRDEALAEFDKWTTAEPMLFQSPGPSVSFRSVEELKAIIRNSSIYDAQQQPDLLIREYLGHTVSFPLNPNPKLFNDSDKQTIAKYTLDNYLPMLFRGLKLIDGCYVDSLGRWPAYNNFRREHFRYSTVPLTYAGTPPKPCLWNLQSHAEYLWELSKRLHAQNKILFANGVHGNRVMLGFAVDALGMEGMPAYDKGDAFYSMRVAAGTKPYCALNGHEGNNPKMWNSCLYLGILVGARSPAGQAMERKYLPAIIQLNEAGWEPVTFARSDNPTVGVERWGGGNKKSLCFSFLNRAKTRATTFIRIDRAELRLPAKITLTDLMSQAAIPIVFEGGQLVFQLDLAPEQATAVVVR